MVAENLLLSEARRAEHGALLEPPLMDSAADASGQRPDMAAASPARWEYVIGVAALVILARSPVLFLRQRLGGLIETPVAPIWQDDGLVRSAFILIELIVLIVAVRTCSPRRLAGQGLLLIFLALTWASMAWSVEPGVTQLRSMMFTGTAVVGWYLGSRFSIRGQAVLVFAAAALGTAASLLALVFWPELARSTDGFAGEWSGVYVNRNILSAVLCLGLLAVVFLFIEADARWRVVLAAVAVVEAFVLWHTGSRSGPVALAIAVGVAFVVFLTRRLSGGRLSPAGGLAVCVALGAIAGVAVHQNWARVLDLLERSSSLSNRTSMWAIDRRYLEMRPWKGWGFETVWAHPPNIAQVSAEWGFPYSSHSGYYEILLGVGKVGFAVFMAFLVVTAWRAFRFAWSGSGLMAIWPLALFTYCIVLNLSESFFVANDAVWALLVMIAFAVTRLRDAWQ